MDEEEATERESPLRRICDGRDTLARCARGVSATPTVFDGAYRRLARAAKVKQWRG